MESQADFHAATGTGRFSEACPGEPLRHDVVIVDPGTDPGTGLRADLEGLEMDALVLERVPQRSTMTLSIQRPLPSMEILMTTSLWTWVKAREVNWLPLVGVEDLRLAIAAERLFQGGDAELGLERVGQPPPRRSALPLEWVPARSALSAS